MLAEVSSMPNWHRIGTNCVRTEPPIVAVHTDFFGSDVVRVTICPFHDIVLQSDRRETYSCGISRRG